MKWDEWFDAWDRDVYQPFFASRGIGKDAALLCYMMQDLSNQIRHLPDLQGAAMRKLLREETGDDTPWKE